MNLKAKLIRLAYENPELRPHVLPLVKSAGMSNRDLWRKYPHAETQKKLKKIWGHLEPAIDLARAGARELYRLEMDLESDYLDAHRGEEDVWSDDSVEMKQEGEWEYVGVAHQLLEHLYETLNGPSQLFDDLQADR